jgi:hypothetical protein
MGLGRARLRLREMRDFLTARDLRFLFVTVILAKDAAPAALSRASIFIIEYFIQALMDLLTMLFFSPIVNFVQFFTKY